MRGVQERRPGVEVLRNLSMFAIVLYHCQMFGLWAWQPQYWCEALHSPLMWHVPAFAAISGWFGIRFSWRKFFKVWGIVLFYSIVGVFWHYYQHGSISIWDIKVDAGWYGGSYLGLMMLSPILNAAAENIAKEKTAATIRVMGLFALMLFLNWSPRHMFTGVAPYGVSGMSLIMLAFFYLSARILAVKYDEIRVYLPRNLLVVLLAVFVALSVCRVFWCFFPLSWCYCNYDSPLIWPMGLILVVLFDRHLKFGGALSGISRFCAPSMFGVYLLHTVSIGNDYIARLQQGIICVWGGHPAMVVIASGFIVFFACIAVDLFRRMIIKAMTICIHRMIG